MFGDANIVIIGAFRKHCALLMCKGALLKDPRKILFRPTENTQAGRQIRLKSVEQITRLENALKGYIRNAIAVEKAGLEVTYKKITDFKMPGELAARFKKDAAMEKAFNALTPGRQRAYYLYFSGAKQAATREARIEKSRPKILQGIGLSDEYQSRKK
jgi:uncharacterized protein YdeI (YjbR/CyaY-like superfamily)